MQYGTGRGSCLVALEDDADDGAVGAQHVRDGLCPFRPDVVSLHHDLLDLQRRVL